MRTTGSSPRRAASYAAPRPIRRSRPASGTVSTAGGAVGGVIALNPWGPGALSAPAAPARELGRSLFATLDPALEPCLDVAAAIADGSADRERLRPAVGVPPIPKRALGDAEPRRDLGDTQ